MEDDGFISTAGKVHVQKFWIPLLHWSVSTAAKVHLQKFWILLLHWSVSTAAKVHLQKFWTLLLHWNDVLNEQNSFCMLRNGILGSNRTFC